MGSSRPGAHAEQLTWRESYVESRAGGERQVLTDFDLSSNAWAISFPETMRAMMPPPVRDAPDGEFRAAFGPVVAEERPEDTPPLLSQRYTDGLFFTVERAARWQLIESGTCVYIPQAGDGGILEARRDSESWGWTLTHPVFGVSLRSVEEREVWSADGSGWVVVGADGQPTPEPRVVAHVFQPGSSSSSEDSDDDEEGGAVAGLPRWR